MLKEEKTPREVVEALYLRCLGREPTGNEMLSLMEVVDAAKDGPERLAVLEDIFWAILNSKEFLFNH